MSPATTSPMISKHPEHELSLSQLLDALEGMMDRIAGTNSSQTDATIHEQVADAIPRISNICRKEKNIKNSLVPINKLPPEIIPLVAAFLNPGRQLINATAVCQHWRVTLLSSPRLWNRIRSSNPTQVGVYLERSKSVPLKVRLRDLDPHLFELLAPHSSRLASLAVSMTNSSNFRRIADYLKNPIPTLHKFSIITPSGLDSLALPTSGVSNNYLLHVKKLRLEGVSSFQAPCAFPHVTELKWHVKSNGHIQIDKFLDTMEQFPALERVEILIRVHDRDFTADPGLHAATLPHVRRLALRCTSQGIPYILPFLKLPSLTSLLVDTPPTYSRTFPTLPVTSFSERLPNFTELPDMGVYSCVGYGQVSFRNSQASFEHYTPAQFFWTPYHHDRILWGGLPLHSVRRLIITIADPGGGDISTCVVNLLRDLRSLEDLRFEGYCGYVLQHLCRIMVQRHPLPGIKTLTVRSGTDEIRQAQELKGVVDGLGLEINVTHVLDPKTLDSSYLE